MSGGAGHVLDAINRLRNNRSLRTSKRQKFKSNNQDLTFSTDNVIRQKEISKDELERIIDDIRKNTKKEQIRDGILFVLITLFVILILNIIFY